MALSYEGASVSWEAFLEFTNYIFTTIFFLECVLKLFAYQRAYFYTNWNRFDFFVVASSLIDIGLKFLPSADGEGDNQVLTVGPQLARVLRVLRVSRVLRLAGKYKGLQALLQTITKAFPAIINVFGLLMLIFFMMATLGVFFFADISDGEIINRFKNFKTWDDAFLLLFAISTGEEWNLIMFDCWRVPPNCIPGIVKIVALGFTMDGGSYIRDSWNQLDFFIVITSMIDFSLGNVELPFIKILRLLRTLRPLRVVSHSKSLRLIVSALFSSTGAIINVSVVVLVVWLMFAIFGINTYKGQFFYCSEDKYFYHLKQTCEEAGHTWQVYDSNFDDILNAMMTLFVVSSLEGWPDIMY